jgi:hypothetical protein
MIPYDRMCGQAGIRREANACRAVHPPNLARPEQRLFENLSG